MREVPNAINSCSSEPASDDVSGIGESTASMGEGEGEAMVD